MNWFSQTFLEPTIIQAVFLISLISALGIILGKLNFKGVSLGITFVFFVGIAVGHLGLEVNKDMIAFAQTFGLVLFVYSLGLQVGPGFFSSMRKGGLSLNLLAMSVVLVGLLLVLFIHWYAEIPMPVLVGMFSGAITNTPALGAAQQA